MSKDWSYILIKVFASVISSVICLTLAFAISVGLLYGMVRIKPEVLTVDFWDPIRLGLFPVMVVVALIVSLPLGALYAIPSVLIPFWKKS